MNDLVSIPVDAPTRVMVNAELLAEAQRHLGIDSSDDVIAEALRRLVEKRRAERLAALERLRQMSDEGVFDYDARGEVDR